MEEPAASSSGPGCRAPLAHSVQRSATALQGNRKSGELDKTAKLGIPEMLRTVMEQQFYVKEKIFPELVRMCQYVVTHGLNISDHSYGEAHQKKTIAGTAESLGETGDSR